MKQRISQALGIVSTIAATWCLAGCGPEPTNVPLPEVRGEAINAPVEPPKADETPDKPAVATDGATTPKVESAAIETPTPAEASAPAFDASPTTPAEASAPAFDASPTTIVEAPAPKKEATIESTVDGFLQIGFDKLASFNYEVPDGPVEPKEGESSTPLKKNQIPDTVKSLNKKRIALQGFMLPLKVENGLITELLIMRDQSMCCYGTVPKINEWVSVKMTGKGVKPIMDQAVTLYGTLKVGEILENGYLVGIYEMNGERMAGPLDL